MKPFKLLAFAAMRKPFSLLKIILELLFANSIDTNRTSVYNAYIKNKRSTIKLIIYIIWKAEMVTDMKNNRTHHYRVVNPIRFFLFVVISIMIIVFAGYTAIGAGNAEATAARTYVQVTIDQGDSLWSIVERCNKDSIIDVQSAIYDVYEINDIEAADIQPGDKLFIPVY